MLDSGMGIALDLLHTYTDDDIAELSRRNPETMFERLSDGRLLVSPPNGWIGGSRNARLTTALGIWNDRAGGGGLTFDSSAGFTLPDKALLAPDAAWLSAANVARLKILQPEDTFAPVCPNLAIEILSPSDRLTIAHRKIDTYIRNGAACAILIDPERGAVEVTTAAGTQMYERPESIVIGTDLLAGATEPLVLDMRPLLEDQRETR